MRHFKAHFKGFIFGCFIFERYFLLLVPTARIARGDVNQRFDESNQVTTGGFVAEVNANDVNTLTRPSKLTNRLSDFKVSQGAGTNRPEK